MRSLLFLPLTLLALTPVFSQRISAPARILGPIGSGSYVRLQKSAPSVALSAYDIGVAPANTEIRRARIILARTAYQRQALYAYIAEERNPVSPDYHKWLTPRQFGERYGLDPDDIATLVQWLQSRGFRVRRVPAGRNVILFSGSVANIEATFQVHVHQFRRDGRKFLSNVDAPAIPAALAPVIQGISGLGTRREQPLVTRDSTLVFNPRKRSFVPATLSGPGYLGLVPGDYATIYNAPNRLNANFDAGDGTQYTGKGVTIGIVGVGNIDLTPIENYRKLFLGEDAVPVIDDPNPVAGSTDSTSSVEAFLDLEVAGGLAPDARLIYYEDTDAFNAFLDAVNADEADILSMSFSSCETGGWSFFSTFTEQAVAQGQAVVVASGDNGADDCDQGSYTPSPATSGFGVNALASTAYNVAVGGSDFRGLIQDFGEYVSTTERANYSLAKGYIPESVWNDTVGSPATVAGSAPNLNIEGNGASGGGLSVLTARPGWQNGQGIPDGDARMIPDVSMPAGVGFDDSSTIVCDENPASASPNSPTMDCTPNAQGRFLASGVGGTSAAAPAFAGILALVEQRTGSRLGNAVEELYALYNSADGSSVFHDIPVGNNSVPCKEGTPDCALNSAGYYYLTGYNAGPVYDMATGLGSVNITNLVNDWGAGSTATPSLLQAVMSSKITSGAVYDDQPVTVEVLVSAPATSDPAPTGTVTLTAGGYTSGATTLTSGSATITIPGNTLDVGTALLGISYSGDSNYDPANVMPAIAVVPVPGVTLESSTPTAIAPGAAASTQVQLQSSNGYAGSITLGCTLTSSPTGAVSAPTCDMPLGRIGLTSNETTSTTVGFTTTAATRSKNDAPLGPWEKGRLGATLAALLLLSIPSKNRAWRNVLCALLIASTIGLVAACGGKSGQPAPPLASPTTSGTYTYSIQATGNPDLTVRPETTVVVTVS